MPPIPRDAPPLRFHIREAKPSDVVRRYSDAHGPHTTLIHDLNLQKGILGLITDLVCSPSEVASRVRLTSGPPQQAIYEKEPESVKATPELVCPPNTYSRGRRLTSPFRSHGVVRS